MEQKQTAIDQTYIDLEQACKYLHIAKPTMYQKTSRKEIKHFKCGRKILFRVSDLKEYVESNEVKTQSELETEAATRLLTQS